VSLQAEEKFLGATGRSGMKRPPAFQFYAKDWLSSATVRTMSLRHRGVFITVLAAMWNSDEPGTLPLPLEVAARSAGLSIRSLRDFVSNSNRCLVEIDDKLVNLKLRAQWQEMQQRQQAQSDAGKRGNEKRWGKPSGGESGGDRSAPASAPASAFTPKEEGCSLVHLSPDQKQSGLQEPVPTRSEIEKAIGKTARMMKPSPATTGGQRAHLEAGIYRKKIEAAYFDAAHAGMKPDECIREAFSSGALSLAGNRSVELRGLHHDDLASQAWKRIGNGIAAIREIKTFESRSRQIVAVVTRCLTDVALEFWEREHRASGAA
jgi:hypothetical protein